ncbi:DUF6380 family protein [Streptomyces sp. NPDC057684]
MSTSDRAVRTDGKRRATLRADAASMTSATCRASFNHRAHTDGTAGGEGA